MANETLITDLVAQEALDQLADLDRAMEETYKTFADVGKELAKGLKIPVEVQGDLDELEKVYTKQMQRAAQATQQLTSIQQQKAQVIANTTNTISRQLAEQEKLNKATREASTEQGKQLAIVDRTLGTYEQNIAALARINKEMQQLKAEYKAGSISAEAYLRKELELKTAKSELQRLLNNETKMMQAVGGSYKQLSQELHRLKETQMQLNDAQRKSAEGQALEKQIQALDAKLKDLDADMGNFQRNVGNYAIAGKSLKSELRELTMQMAQMLADGVDPTSEAFLRVAERAGTLKDAMSDATATINDYANDTQGLTQSISIIETAAGGWQTFEGALSAFGLESKDAAAATQKLMGIMSLMNGVQKISTELTTNGTGAYRAYHAILKLLGIERATHAAATQAETTALQAGAVAAAQEATAQAAGATATEAATVAAGAHTAAVGVEAAALTGATAAATALKLALAALGIGAVIALVVTLYESIKEFNEDAEKSAKIVEDLAKANEDAKTTYMTSKAEMERYISVLDNFNGTKEEEKALIDELNNKYGTAIGNYQTLNQWKQALIDTGLAYIETLEWEARAQAALNAMIAAEKDGNREDAEFYKDQYYGYMEAVQKERARLQRMRQQNSTPAKTASGNKQSSGKGNKNAGGSSANDERNALKEMQQLIDEANELYGDWEKTVAERGIEMAAVITSTSADAMEKQLAQVRAHYGKLAELLEKDRENTKNETAAKYQAAIDEANKFHKDTTELENARTKAIETIDKGYNQRIEDNAADLCDTLEQMQQDFNTKRLEEIANTTEKELAGLSASNTEKAGILQQEYMKELELARGNEEKIAEIKERYARESADMAQAYAIKTAEITIAGLEKALAVEGLSNEQREKLSKQLADAKIKHSEMVKNAEKTDLEDTVTDEGKARNKRLEKVEQWVHAVEAATARISELWGAIYDGQIAKVDEELEAEQLHHDTQMAQIEELAERGAITTEEAELRKREAEARTAKAQEALEKKKAQLEYRRAVMEKANTISQIAIATALAIMKATPNWVNVALVAAMGAVQMATALAQPIKAYKEGTKGVPHPGGLAVVGDGGKQELVAFGRNVWLTPDIPTLVDLPTGAQVFPEVTQETINQLAASLPVSIPRDKSTGLPVVINDYSDLQQQVIASTKALARELRAQSREMSKAMRQQAFAAYLKRRL